MKQLLLTISFAFLSAFALADAKIGVIDLERAMNEVDEGAKAKADLKKEFEIKQAVLDKKQDEIKKLQESFENQASVMKPEVRQNKAMELQKKAGEAQQLYMTMQQEMMKRQQDVMGNILQKMAVVSSALSKEGGYDLILNKNETTVLFAKPALDLTSEAIRKFNAIYPNKVSTKKK